MSILFLVASDQRSHYLSKYVDLKCNFDFKNWTEGVSAISSDYICFDYFEYFIINGPLKTEYKIREIINENLIKVIIIPNFYYELSNKFLNQIYKENIKLIMVTFDDSNRYESHIKCFLEEIDAIVTHESIDSLRFYPSDFKNANFFPLYPSVSLTKKILSRSSRKKISRDDVVFVG